MLLGPDIHRIQKMLARYELFKLGLDVPGDIVECGVFKGVGLLYWLKLLRIFSPSSGKRVVGFDAFGTRPPGACEFEQQSYAAFAADADWTSGSCDVSRIERLAELAQVRERLEVVVGDIGQTGPAYVASNPGFRISLLHLDVDTYHGTRAALEAFFPRVVKGGVVVLDEYACRGWGESHAADECLGRYGVQLKAVPNSVTPSAYLIK